MPYINPREAEAAAEDEELLAGYVLEHHYTWEDHNKRHLNSWLAEQVIRLHVQIEDVAANMQPTTAAVDRIRPGRKYQEAQFPVQIKLPRELQDRTVSDVERAQWDLVALQMQTRREEEKETARIQREAAHPNCTQTGARCSSCQVTYDPQEAEVNRGVCESCGQ